MANTPPPNHHGKHHYIKFTETQKRELLKQARVDAAADPAGTESCQSWENTLQNIANMAMEQMKNVFERFKSQCMVINDGVDKAHHKAKELLAPEHASKIEADAKENMQSQEALDAIKDIRDNTTLLNKYRARFHHLDKSVKRPHKANTMLFVGFAVLLIAVESAINSQLFAEGSSYGLAGGALAAVAVSVLNVIPLILLAMLAKKCLGNLYFPSWAWQAICVVALVYAVGFNWFAMQLRNDLVINPNTEIVDASEQGDMEPMRSALEKPLPDSEKNKGWILFIIGLIVTAACFWKGWSFVDGYAKVRECMQSIEQSKNTYTGIVMDPINAGIKECRDARENLSRLTAELRSAIKGWGTTRELLLPDAVAEVRQAWNLYNKEYALLHLDPDPKLPSLKVENASDWSIEVEESWGHFSQTISAQAQQEQEAIGKDIEALSATAERVIGVKNNFIAVVNVEIEQAQQV